jgi:uncharacterized protein YcnI
MLRAGRMGRLLLAAAAIFVSTAAEAHVRIAPAESKAGAAQTYTARVPTEGTVATTSVQLDVPDGVTIVTVAAHAGATYELRRESERVVAVIWTVTIKPGENAELSFVARNPGNGDQIVWKVHQRYADGTSSEWVGPAGSRGPAPITKLLSSSVQ